MSFNAKRNTAVFAGATSGGPITLDTVRLLSLPRLKSAVYFKGSAWVDFTLPQIVQTDGPETVAAIGALGVGGDVLPWEGQFNHRYIISIDGNGATCSRLAIVLQSQSVLLKYNSPNQLFYFRGIVPWRHFVPIGDDADVERVVQEGEFHQGFYEEIAIQGRHFFKQHLTRDACEAYTAELIQKYAKILQTGKTMSPSVKAARLADSQLRCVAHIQDLGDVDGNSGGWVVDPRLDKGLEGVTFFAPEQLPDLELEYHGVSADGHALPICRNGEFCGTRGLGAPLRGFSINIVSRHKSDLSLQYQLLSRDGQMTPFRKDGELSVCEGGSPVISLKLILRRMV